MANDFNFTVTPVTDLLPGRYLRSASIVKLGGQLNFLLGNATYRSKVFHKGLPDAYAAGIASLGNIAGVAVAATDMFAAPLRIPRVSTAHVELYCRARVTVAGAGNATVAFTTAGTPDTLALVSAAAGPVDLEGTVAFDVSAAYDDIMPTLETDANTTIVVHSVEVWVQALADPIPAATDISSAQPFGVTSLGPDYPHDAGLNEAFIDALETLRPMARVFFADAAIATAVNGDGLLLDRLHLTWVTSYRNALQRDLEMTVWVNGDRPAAPANSYAYIQIGSQRGWPTPVHPILFNADGWKTETFPMPGFTVIDSMPVPSFFLGIWPAESGTDPRGRTTTEVKSMTVWGP